MSRQPMGILASSPELMTAAQRAMAQGQPMQAATGASVNLNDSIANQLNAIQQLRGMGDKATLNNIATDKRLPRSVQMAAANALAGIEAQSDEPTQQVPLAPTDRLGSLASGTPVMSVRGSGEDVPVNVGVSAEQVPVSSIPEGGISSITDVDPMTKIGSSMSTEMMNRIRKARDLEPLPETTSDSLVGAARAAVPEGTPTLGMLAENQAETQRLMTEGQRGGEKIGERSAYLESIGAGPEPEAPAAEAPAAEAEAKEDKTPDPVTAAEKIITDPSTLLPQISTTLGDKDKTNKQKADATDAALGIKGTRKERVEQRYEMLKDLLGEEKADDIRTDVGYNLMMTGLMIAAGQSPDAMTNIATGLAKGLQGYGEAAGEAAQEARKEEKAIKLMAAKEVGEEITAEQAAKIRARELADERSFRERMKDLEIDAAYERANIPSATQRLYETYLEPEQIKAVLTKTKDGSGPQVMSRERFVADSLNKTASVDAAMADLAAQGIDNPTQSQIAEHLGRVYDGIIAGPSAAASQGSAQTVDVSAHQAANAAAKEAGQSTYIVDGKSYKVQ